MEGTWRKSSYSQGGEGNCVEVSIVPNSLFVRDSKAPNGGTLKFAPAAASAWRTAVKAGQFDR